MPRTLLVQQALACCKCASRGNHKDTCNRTSSGERYTRYANCELPYTPSRKEDVLAHFATLHLSLVPSSINVSAFTPVLKRYLDTNNAIFCTVVQYLALSMGNEFVDLALKYHEDRNY